MGGWGCSKTYKKVTKMRGKRQIYKVRDVDFGLEFSYEGYCCSANLHFEAEFGIFRIGDDIMKQFTPSEAKKLVKDILAQKKLKAEYFQAKGTLKGFAPAK